MNNFDTLVKEALDTLETHISEEEFDEYFVYEGQQPLDMKGEKTMPMFTLRKHWDGLTLKSTYGPNTLRKHGIPIPEKYFQKQYGQ